MFVQRYLKQRDWDSQRSLHRSSQQRKAEVLNQQAAREDKQRGQNLHTQGGTKSQRNTRSVRMRTCKRCGTQYIAGGTRATDECCWHKGSYVCVDEDGVFDHDSKTQAAANRAIQKGRKKGGKRTVTLLPDAKTGRMVWICCGEENMLAKGCVCGSHV